MSDFTRYAVYYAPEEGAFSEFCDSWLGWSARAGCDVLHPEMGLLDVAQITQTPRKYGFHGTIKPPFRLTKTPEALTKDFRALCARLRPVTCDGLELTALGRFLALTIKGDTADLADLAASVVKTLDPHRMPPTEAELERRRASNLSERQEELLAKWGYPYVMDQFKFHLTLSGRLDNSEIEAVKAALQARLTPLLPTPFEVNTLCLFGEAKDGRFHLIERCALTG